MAFSNFLDNDNNRYVALISVVAKQLLRQDTAFSVLV